MARNLSVSQFQSLMANVPKAVAAELEDAVLDQANSLAWSMRLAAPRGKKATHELQASIRVEEGRHPLRKLVKAGGPRTTKDGYDYSLAIEFGTQKAPAEPFFWPTYRARKKKIRSELDKRARAAIARVVRLD